MCGCFRDPEIDLCPLRTYLCVYWHTSGCVSVCVFTFAHVFLTTGAQCCLCSESEPCVGTMTTKGGRGWSLGGGLEL